jgi:hypothetical protein
VYDLRHTFAAFALRAGISTFDLSRYMGASLTMIDRHYGHLARDGREHAINSRTKRKRPLSREKTEARSRTRTDDPLPYHEKDDSHALPRGVMRCCVKSCKEEEIGWAARGRTWLHVAAWCSP